MSEQQPHSQQRLIQLVQQSSQPSVLIDIPSSSIIEINTHCGALLALNDQEINGSSFYEKTIKKANQLINKQLDFFNFEIFSDNKIFIVIGEVSENHLIIHFQEKFNYNMPSSHLINILDSLGAYVYCKDTNYNFTYGNKMVGDLFGIDHKTIKGTARDYLAESSADNVHQNIDSLVLNNRQEIEIEENVYIENIDENRTFLSVKKPLFGKRNEVVGLFGISTDITSYKAIEKKIRLSEQKLNTILDNVAAYIYIKDLDLKFTYVNKMTINLLDRKEEDIIGKSTDELLGREASKEFRLLDQKLLDKKEVVSGIEKLTTDNGDLFYWTVKAPLYDEDHNFSGLIGMSTDISEQKQLEQKLEKTNIELQYKIDEITKLQANLWEQATQDPLTQLYNRRYFNEIAQKELSKSERKENPLSLLLIDADYFKQINDLFGHAIGDKVLIKLAQIMLDQCRRSDIVCRFGGEEFVILMPDINQQVALDRANKIRTVFHDEVTNMLEGHDSSISIGLAMWNKSLIDLEGLTKAADQAMYQAKHSGRNRVCIFTS